jgi:hypothetical protein
MTQKILDFFFKFDINNKCDVEIIKKKEKWNIFLKFFFDAK